MKQRVLSVAAVACIGIALASAGCGRTPSADPTTAAVGAWTELDPGGDLPSSPFSAAAYDSGTGKVILCGQGSYFLMNTWIYDLAANTWTDVGHSEGARLWGVTGSALAYDPTSEKTFLFGGGAMETDSNDTWAYDASANTWTQLEPSGELPTARAGHSMAYDPATRKIIMFGGVTTAGEGDDGLPFHFFNDTWAFDPAANAWTELHPSGGAPSPRSGLAMAYGAGSGKILLFGGGGLEGAEEDTWTYDPIMNVWTELAPAGDSPYGRDSHSMAYDSQSGRVVLFGGHRADSRGLLNDTWAYESVSNTWIRLAPGGDLPPARSDHFMAYDPTSGRVILMGGMGDSALLLDVWVYDDVAP